MHPKSCFPYNINFLPGEVKVPACPNQGMPQQLAPALERYQHFQESCCIHIWRRRHDPLKHLQLHDQQHSITSLMTSIFSNTAVKTSNLTAHCISNSGNRTGFRVTLFIWLSGLDEQNIVYKNTQNHWGFESSKFFIQNKLCIIIYKISL